MTVALNREDHPTDTVREGSTAFPCPSCGKFDGSAVKDSRPANHAIKRRRVCVACGFRFSTWEIISAFNPMRPPRQLRESAALLRRAADRLDGYAENLEHGEKDH